MVHGPWSMETVVVLSKAAVKQLAEADMQEVVKEVREIYIDYLPIGGALHYVFHYGTH